MKLNFNMKKRIVSSSLVTLIVLFSGISVNGQEQTTTDDIRGYINTIKNKASEANIYAEKIYSAGAIADANTYAKQTLLILEEAKNMAKNAQSAIVALSTPENKNKSARNLTSIANDIFDLQNKIEWATHETNKIIKLNELEEIKYAANEVITETKKMNDVIAEIMISLALTDQELNAID